MTNIACIEGKAPISLVQPSDFFDKAYIHRLPLFSSTQKHRVTHKFSNAP